ncbi:MAG: PASTA domain-containing protein [Candidatus Zipacnadales bacterium]
MPIDLQHWLNTSSFAQRWIGCDRHSGRKLLVTLPHLSTQNLDNDGQARVLAAVRRYRGLIHPHICALVEVGFTESGQLIVVQELPPWLSEPTGTMRFTEGRGIETLIHVCEGLAYAHARDMVHGALTRDCIFMGETQDVRIADFGVGAALVEAGVLSVYAEGVNEISPESKAGQEPTPKSDVFSLGALGIELCSVEQTALQGATPRELMQRARQVPSAGLAATLGRAVEIDPQARFATAEEMLRQLRTLSPLRASGSQVVTMKRQSHSSPASKVRKAARVAEQPEMGYAQALGLLLWTLLRSLLALSLSLMLIAAAVAGGLALAFRDTPALVTVPNLEGRSVAEAATAAEAKGLKVTVVRKTHHDTVPVNHVIEHSPYPGKIVREGRTVELVVSLGPAETTVPKLVGKSLAEAQKLLDAAGLRLGAVSRDPSSVKLSEEVLAQNPPSGKKVTVDSEVNVMVSAGRKGGSSRDREGPRAADITLIVPQGPVVQRVRIEVHYPTGRYTIAYERVHRPGDKVQTHVAAPGEATVHILIDGELVREIELMPSS